jgi:hypothetical protein
MVLVTTSTQLPYFIAVNMGASSVKVVEIIKGIYENLNKNNM